MMIRPLLFALSFSLFLSNGHAESLAAADLQPTALLRGYGKVKAEFGANRVLFECEDAEHADILLGKLLADLFWDAGPSHVEKNYKVAQREILLHQWQPYGAMVAAALDKRVMVVGAETEEALLRRIEKEPLILSPEARFKPSKPYPQYLDFYDLKAFNAYATPMGSAHGEGLDSHWAFVKKFALGGLAFQSFGFWSHSPAPGVVEWTPTDYAVRTAEKQGGCVAICPAFGGEAPLWDHNRLPFTMMQPSPTSLLGAWGGVACAGAHFESWWTPVEQRLSTSLDFQKQIMERYKESPSVGGWHLSTGAPGGEFGFHERTGEFWDYSPAGETGFRQWLREIRGFDLKTLGLRWYNDAKRFTSWDDVKLPDVNSFYGNLDAQCLRLDANWKWLKAEKGVEQPPPTTSGWVPVAMPPSQQQSFLPWGAAFYRTEFDADEWLGKNAGRDVFLVCAVNIRSNQGTGVWLNGRLLGQHQSKIGVGNPGPFALQVNEFLQKGKNELTLRAPSGGSETSEGKIFGPVFLTTTEPHYYPYNNAQQNARYADFKNWQNYSIYRAHAPMLDLARAIDPDRPFILSGTASGETDHIAELAARYGAGVQMTGREGWYHPWWAGIGYVAGFYGTSEPSATARGSVLDHMLGWIFIDGDSSHDLFQDVEDYIQEEKANGYFTKNQRLIQLFGKYLREKPAIAIFRSALTMRLGSPLPWNWDIGRGELQSVHFDNVYATERELQKGLVNGYPVLFDAGSEFMEEETVAALRRYVENGGVFVALHNTGLHTPLEAHSHPISKLTGFDVVSAEKKGGIHFLDKLPAFKGWEGKEFEGEGSSLDWMGNQTAGGNGLALRPNTTEAIPLALWEDGSVAIGYRPLGKGRIIILGSSFWRNGKDAAGQWHLQSELEAAFFERLFTDLGIQRNAQASRPDVWTRKVITKNGLQEWLIAFNSDAVEAKTDVSFRVERQPAEVWDLTACKTVAFNYSKDGWVRISDVTIPGSSIRAFGVKRANLAEGLPFWWSEKTTYWKQCEVQNKEILSKLKTPMNETHVIAFDQWKFLPDKANMLASGTEWTSPAFDDKEWRSLRTGPWNLLDESLKDYQGLGLYRAKFVRPESWKGRRVALGLYSFNDPIVNHEGDFYLNGTQVAKYKARGWSQTLNYDVTDQLHEGENVLAVKVIGGKEFSGMAGTVWMETERNLLPAIDLAGAWQKVKNDFLTTEEVKLPGSVRGAFLVRNIEIPATWKERSIFLHMETPGQWVGCVVLNGRPISYNSYLHPYGLRADINLTPFAKPGQTNRLEIWPMRTLAPAGEDGLKGVKMEITAITIGCEEQIK